MSVPAEDREMYTASAVSCLSIFTTTFQAMLHVSTALHVVQLCAPLVWTEGIETITLAGEQCICRLMGGLIDLLLVSLDTAMEGEREAMKLAMKITKEKLPKMQESIDAVELTTEDLVSKGEDLEDEINDMFDQIVAMLEERRTCLLNQLHSRIDSKREKLGKFE